MFNALRTEIEPDWKKHYNSRSEKMWKESANAAIYEFGLNPDGVIYKILANLPNETGWKGTRFPRESTFLRGKSKSSWSFIRFVPPQHLVEGLLSLEEKEKNLSAIALLDSALGKDDPIFLYRIDRPGHRGDLSISVTENGGEYCIFVSTETKFGEGNGDDSGSKPYPE